MAAPTICSEKRTASRRRPRRTEGIPTNPRSAQTSRTAPFLAVCLDRRAARAGTRQSSPRGPGWVTCPGATAQPQMAWLRVAYSNDDPRMAVRQVCPTLRADRFRRADLGG